MIKSKQCRVVRLLILLLVLPGCGDYGKVEQMAYEHVKSLYTVCNQKNVEQLEKFSERLSEAHEAEKISSQELEWLEAIVEEARGGEWNVAASKCRQLMEAQVQR